jgi:hypothetical protein
MRDETPAQDRGSGDSGGGKKLDTTVTPAADEVPQSKTLQTVSLLNEIWRGALDISARIARENGYQQGWFAGVAEERHAWNRIIAAYHDVIDAPLRAERDELRDDPCGDRRPEHQGRCSRCVRAAAVARYGGDFPGRSEVAS